MENDLGDRADLRAGIGLGLSSVSTNGGSFRFAYDFLLGWSYRVSDNWRHMLDYRYLTAASKDIAESRAYSGTCHL